MLYEALLGPIWLVINVSLIRESQLIKYLYRHICWGLSKVLTMLEDATHWRWLQSLGGEPELFKTEESLEAESKPHGCISFFLLLAVEMTSCLAFLLP